MVPFRAPLNLYIIPFAEVDACLKIQTWWTSYRAHHNANEIANVEKSIDGLISKLRKLKLQNAPLRLRARRVIHSKLLHEGFPVDHMESSEDESHSTDEEGLFTRLDVMRHANAAVGIPRLYANNITMRNMPLILKQVPVPGPNDSTEMLIFCSFPLTA